MVSPVDPRFLHYLDLIQRDEARGIVERERAYRKVIPHLRTLYRLERRFGDGLIYYPRVRFGALGLTTLHVFLRNPDGDWSLFPLAYRSAWLSQLDGDKILYFQALAPINQVHDVLRLFHQLEGDGLADRIVVIPTSDGWQHLKSLATWYGPCGHLTASGSASIPREQLTDRPEESGLLHSWPFIVPVVCEQLERRASSNTVWRTMADRLGPRVWHYLPHRRQVSRNGNALVAQTLRLLNRTAVFRQNVVRYQPLLRDPVEVYLLTAPLSNDALQRLFEDLLTTCPDVEAYPATTNKTLFRLVGDHTMIDKLVTVTRQHRPTDFFVRDKTITPPPVRFAYERFFNPKTKAWTIPADEIRDEMNRGRS